MDAKTLFADPAKRAMLSSRFAPPVTVPNIMRDTAALSRSPGAQADVRQPEVGITGYCMGGRHGLRRRRYFPDRIAAAASYHAASLATDAPDSPHLLAAKIKARVYVAARLRGCKFPRRAEGASRRSASGRRRRAHAGDLSGAARLGAVGHAGARPACTERHWQTLLDLLSRSLSA